LKIKEKYQPLLLSCHIGGVTTMEDTQTLGFMQIQIQKRDKYGK